MSSVPRLRGRWVWAAATLLLAFVLALCMTLALWAYRGHRLSAADPARRVAARLAEVDLVQRQKLCAHRCDNIPKYREAQRLFDCIELDVVIDPPIGGETAVYHPPTENHHGLALDFLLSNETPPRGKLWLDVKDLSAGNWQSFLRDISVRIDPQRRGETIVETGWADAGVQPAVKAFRESGFLISYYLPTEDAIACGTDRSAACEDLRAKVLQTVSLGFSHLSFDARAYPFVGTLRDRLPAGLRLLTWDLSEDWPDRKLLDEVEVYIVRFPSGHST